MDTPSHWRTAIAGLTLVVAAGLLFSRLGYYPLWDDEALTAMGARAVWKTGDVSALWGNNIVAYRQGVLLHNLKDRLEAPLQFYFLAPMTAIAGQSTFLLRLPFALIGLACWAWILFWMRKDGAPPTFYVLMCVGLVTNVSLILFCRQCRYYSLAIFLSLVVAYLYLHWRSGIGYAMLLAGFSILLFLASYLNWADLYGAIAIDFLLFSRKRMQVRRRDWAALLLPQAAVAVYIICTRHATLARYRELFEARGVSRLTHVWYLIRDCNLNQFFTLAVLMVAAVFAVRQGNKLILRGLIALAVYVVLSALLYSTPPPLGEVRYVVPVIPLAIAVEAATLALLIKRAPMIGLLAAGLVFGTDILNQFPSASPAWGRAPEPGSTTVEYVRELVEPPANPYTPTLAWMERHVQPGQSVSVWPGNMAYPLMFYDPQVIYAWQLDWPPEAQFAGLPAVDFVDQSSPDYFIAFGPYREDMESHLARTPRLGKYQLVAVLCYFGADHYRPELYWRTFRTLPIVSPQTEQIYVYHRAPLPKLQIPRLRHGVARG